MYVIALDQLSNPIRLWEIRSDVGDHIIGTIKMSNQRYHVESEVGDFLADSFYEARDEVQKRLDARLVN